MLKRSSKKEKFPGFWIGPGGHVEAGEDYLTAAIREVKEETGIEIKTSTIKLKISSIHHHLDRGEVWVNHIYLVKLKAFPPLIPTDEGKHRWIPIKRLMTLKQVFPPSKIYFDHVLHDKPGIMYTHIQWKKSQLVKILSQKVDRDY